MTQQHEVEEDGDEVFTPMPKTCPQWRVTDPKTLNGQICGGKVENMGGFMRCKICFASFGPAEEK